jgi:NDP-sugar pyrophosphorylase family protein
MKAIKCLIPAAGHGLRARPDTAECPKGMLRIGDKPILRHTIELVRDQLGVTEVVIVIGHLGAYIRDYFRDGHWLDVNIGYIHNTEIDKGLAWSIYLGRDCIEDDFLVVLGDEYYHHSNHAAINRIVPVDALAVCAVMKTLDHTLIRRNYTVICTASKRIISLSEKPKEIRQNLMGTGTFVLSRRIFDCIGKRFDKSEKGVGFIELLDELCQQGGSIYAVELQGEYVNINDLAALERANLLYSGR